MYTIHSKLIKILIIRLSSIGDILLSTPFVRQVRQAFPNAIIDYIVKSKYQELLNANPNIDSLLVIDTDRGYKELKKLRKHIQNTSYNYIFDLHNNIRSNYLRYRVNADYINSIKKNKFKQSALVYFNKNKYKTILSIPDRYLQVGETVGVCDDGLGLDLYWKNSYENRLHQILKENGLNHLPEPYICVAPGAGFFTKRWPLESYKHLLTHIHKEYQIPCVLLGGQDDEKLGTYLSINNNIYNLVGKTSLLDSAIILSKSSLLVANDSGLMHMATAVQIPVIAIFGSSVKELGFFPYRSVHKVIELDGLDCRPCSHIGKSYCPKKHFKCMKDISPETVFKEVKLLLNNIK
jgi:lipopolysaccharide heptosyltransferase II